MAIANIYAYNKDKQWLGTLSVAPSIWNLIRTFFTLQNNHVNSIDFDADNALESRLSGSTACGLPLDDFLPSGCHVLFIPDFLVLAKF